MIGVLTHHWTKEKLFEKARHILDRNGAAQSRAPGFINRTTLLSKNNHSQISSLVIWENDEIYDQWKASPERVKAMKNADSMWSQPPISERFDIP